jgi:hypothetical protein
MSAKQVIADLKGFASVGSVAYLLSLPSPFFALEI